MPDIKLPPQVAGLRVQQNDDKKDFVLQLMMVAYVHRKRTKKGKHEKHLKQYDILLPYRPKPKVIESYIKSVSDQFKEYLDIGEFTEYDYDELGKAILPTARTVYFNDWIIFDMNLNLPVASKGNKHEQVDTGKSNLKQYAKKVKKAAEEIK